MSQENVDLAYRANDAFNRRDLDAWLALTDPNVEFTTQIMKLESGGPYHGHEGTRKWWEALLGAFANFSGEIEEVRDLGDMTVMRVHQRAQGIESDAPTEETQWIATQWRNGRATWWGVFQSEGDALEAAGLRD